MPAPDRVTTCPECQRSHLVPESLPGPFWSVCVDCLDAESQRYAQALADVTRSSQGSVSLSRIAHSSATLGGK